MTSAVNFAIHERDGAGARLALSCGALGDVRRAPRIIKYDAARRAESGGTRGEPGGRLLAPATVEVCRSSAAAPAAAARAEHLARFQATAWREMEATLPPLPRLPPLLPCSVLGPGPF